MFFSGFWFAKQLLKYLRNMRTLPYVIFILNLCWNSYEWNFSFSFSILYADIVGFTGKVLCRQNFILLSTWIFSTSHFINVLCPGFGENTQWTFRTLRSIGWGKFSDCTKIICFCSMQRTRTKYTKKKSIVLYHGVFSFRHKKNIAFYFRLRKIISLFNRL